MRPPLRPDEHAVAVLYLDLDSTVRKGFGELGRFVNGPADVEVFPEAVTLMRAWKSTGGRIVGVSNQGGIALNRVDLADVALAMVETQHQCGGLFDKIAWCQHHPDAVDPEMARCWCRKPRAGMLIESVLELRAQHPSEYYPPHLALMVGDRPEDQAAADAANVTFRWAHEWRASAPQEVWCTYCHKAHTVTPGAEPCAPGAWQKG